LFLGQIALELDREPMRLSPAALETLHAHRWPGNVRELRNALERAALLSHGPELGPEEFSFEPKPGAAAASAAGDGSLLETEKDLIRKTLEAERGRVGRAAELLGISRSSLYEKLRRYGIAVSRN
jgi:DNA-binding NtrC family response regulator